MNLYMYSSNQVKISKRTFFFYLRKLLEEWNSKVNKGPYTVVYFHLNLSLLFSPQNKQIKRTQKGNLKRKSLIESTNLVGERKKKKVGKITVIVIKQSLLRLPSEFVSTTKRISFYK